MFGAAWPRMVLRLLVVLYPRDGDHRAELLAELHGIPRWVRPFWVTEQVPLAFREGLGDRHRSGQASKMPESSAPVPERAAKTLDRQSTPHALRFDVPWSTSFQCPKVPYLPELASAEYLPCGATPTFSFSTSPPVVDQMWESRVMVLLVRVRPSWLTSTDGQCERHMGVDVAPVGRPRNGADRLQSRA
jgi:hypothetical protein